MRCLVVGGAGFVGSHVVDRLLAEGHTVDVVDDLSTGSLSNLAVARAEHVGALKFHNVDVRQPELADLLGRLRPEVAVHLALPSSGPAARVLSTALGGTANLLDAAVVQHDDLLGDLHRLLLVVRHEHGRDVDLVV